MAHVTPYCVAWRLQGQGVSPRAIAHTLNVHHATVYRWLAGIRLRGLRDYERWMRTCKRRRRRRRIDPRTIPFLVAYRRQHEWCGEKLVWWLREVHGIRVSKSTVYRILGEHFHLRSKWVKQHLRGPLPRASAPRHVLQADTVDLGGLFALFVVDTFTREAVTLPLRSLESKEVAGSVAALQGRFGTVELLQVDNGPEFHGKFPAAVQGFAHRLRYIRPGVKEENAFVESFQRSLRRHAVGWHRWRREEYDQLAKTLQRFCRVYNHETPHLSLNLTTPAAYALSHLT